MTSLAIPSVPPPATANVDAATPPAETDSRFGDALRESQAQPKATKDGHPGDPDAGSSPHKNAGATAAKQDDKAGAKDTTVLPGMIPAVPVTPVPVRQSAATTGKSVPATAPAGVQTADLQSKPLSPALAAQASAAYIPDINPSVVATPVAQATVTKTLGSNTPVANARMANVADKQALVAGASGANAPIAQPDAAEAAETATSDTDISTALGASDVDADAPAVDQHQDSRVLPNSGPNAFTAQLAQLAGMQAGTAPAQPPTAPAQLTMQSAPGQPQFAQEVGQNISWLAGQNIQQAEIQLNPRKLGPIQVEITTHHDRVDVTFAVQHPQTVHALQQTLPQLHDMLAQQGLNLGHASVGQQAPGRQHPGFAQHTGTGGAGRDSGNTQADPPANWRTLRVAVPGRVDDFA